MFFRDWDLTLRRVADVKSVAFIPDDQRTHALACYRVTMQSGEIFEICEDSYDTIVHAAAHYVPAQDGFLLIEYRTNFGDSSQEGFFRLPVLAWRVSDIGKTRPVVSSGVCDIEDWFVISPDGTIFNQWGDLRTEGEHLKRCRDEL